MDDYRNHNQAKEDDNFLHDVSDAIAEQVQREMDSDEFRQKRSRDEIIDDILDETNFSFEQDFNMNEGDYDPRSMGEEYTDDYYGEDYYPDEDTEEDDPDGEIPLHSSRGSYGGRGGGAAREKKKPNFWQKMPLWGKICSVIGVILLLVLLAAVGYYEYLLSLIHHQNEEDTAVTDHTITESTEDNMLETTTDDPLPALDPNKVTWNPDTVYRHEQGVLNFLLVGEENIEDDNLGRSDSMIIVTLNQNTRTLALTSILRDCYVQIPDYHGNSYRDNKINASFQFGGITLLRNTIEDNFNIQIDGFAKVNFDGFEDVIDALGGVEITLSKKEAKYLNTTNYISKKRYRNVKEGTQILNGNQALGYSRIRYVSAPNGLANDWGRTWRQRNVLNALFEAYRNSSLADLVAMLPEMMKLVTTDLSKEQITDVLEIILAMRPEKLETMTIPVDDGYQDRRISGVGLSLLLDMDYNVERLHEFIFGDGLENATDSTESSGE